MKKKDIHSYKNKYLLFCILISIVCPLGIPFIPIGFVMGGPIWLAAGILGIALTAFGFYGIPLFWIAFGTVNRRTHIYDAVTVDFLYSTEAIATQTSYPQKLIKRDVDWLLKKRYLTGFLFNGASLTLNENRKIEKVFENKHPCPHCGGSETVRKESGYYCAYCGSQLFIIE